VPLLQCLACLIRTSASPEAYPWAEWKATEPNRLFQKRVLSGNRAGSRRELLSTACEYRQKELKSVMPFSLCLEFGACMSCGLPKADRDIISLGRKLNRIASLPVCSYAHGVAEKFGSVTEMMEFFKKTGAKGGKAAAAK